MYSLLQDPKTILRLTDGAFIPANTDNSDYVAYLNWRAAGNTPHPTIDLNFYTFDDGEVVAKPLDDTKAFVKAQLANLRYEKQVEGIIYNNCVFATDDQAKISYLASLIQVQANSNHTVLWKAKDLQGNSTFVSLSSSDISILANAVANYIQECFNTESTKSQEIDSVTTIEDLQAVSLNDGWPTRNY